MSLNDLPTWILWKIAQDSSDVYRGLVTANRKLGLWSLKNQGIIQNLFTVKTYVHDIPYTYTKYELCGKLHRIDGPAIEYSNGRPLVKCYHRDAELPSTQFSNGDKEWYFHGVRHRENGPAIEYSHGSRQWWVNGKLHRDDGPAIEYTDGSMIWYVHGVIHRENAPAIEYSDGTRQWWVNGKLHRDDGPAIERPSGTYPNRYCLEWWINGVKHRENSPAIEYSNGTRQWWVTEN